MSWHDVDAPDQVAAETGPNLATGDYTATNPDWTLADGVWSREGGGLLLLATDQWGEMAFTPDAHYEVRADVHGATAYKSLVNVDGGGDQATLPVEAPLPETLPGDGWVQVTQAGRAPTDPATGSFAIEATGPGLVQVRNPPVAVRTGRIILTVPGDVLAENIMASGGIVAGTPGGARVELNEEGLLAFDATNTETARINGEGGEFVGGEFRTSDNLPGQVTLSNTANQGTPGISIEPEDDAGYDVLPSIGPGPDDMRISGGVSTAGDIAGAQFRAGGTTLYWNGPGATGGGAWATVADGEAGLRYRTDRTNANYESAIRARTNDAVVYSEGPNGEGFISASPGSAYLAHVSPGDPTARSQSRATATPEYLMLERKVPGVNDRHRLVLDDDGVWVQTVFGANPVSHNLFDLISRVNDLEARVAALEA